MSDERSMADRLHPGRNTDIDDRRLAVRDAILAQIKNAGYQATWDIFQLSPDVEIMGEMVPVMIDPNRFTNQLAVKFSRLHDGVPRGGARHFAESPRRGCNITAVAAEIMRRARALALVYQEVARADQIEDLNRTMLTAVTEDLHLPSGCTVRPTTVPNRVELKVSVFLDPLSAREVIEHLIRAVRRAAQEGESDEP